MRSPRNANDLPAPRAGSAGARSGEPFRGAGGPCRSAAVDGAELDATIERVAQIVGAEADEGLARTDAVGRDPRPQLPVLLLEVLLDHLGPLLREHLVGGG